MRLFVVSRAIIEISRHVAISCYYHFLFYYVCRSYLSAVHSFSKWALLFYQLWVYLKDRRQREREEEWERKKGGGGGGWRRGEERRGQQKRGETQNVEYSTFSSHFLNFTQSAATYNPKNCNTSHMDNSLTTAKVLIYKNFI